MKQKKLLILFLILVFTVLAITGIEAFRKIKIYQMPINAWKRTVWNAPDSTQKEENFVIYHHVGKSQQRIIDSVIAYNDRTISIDTIIKYRRGYCRDFFKRDWTLNRNYTEESDGSDIIFDHTEKRVFSISWQTYKHEMMEIVVNGDTYIIPVNDSTLHIITSIQEICKHSEYMLR